MFFVQFFPPPLPLPPSLCWLQNPWTKHICRHSVYTMPTCTEVYKWHDCVICTTASSQEMFLPHGPERFVTGRRIKQRPDNIQKNLVMGRQSFNLTHSWRIIITKTHELTIVSLIQYRRVVYKVTQVQTGYWKWVHISSYHQHMVLFVFFLQAQEKEKTIIQQKLAPITWISANAQKECFLWGCYNQEGGP